MEKDFETVLLLDLYAGLLTEKQRRLCGMYYDQDYSLAEIAEIEHTTRQAVRDGIEKARQKLHDMERCLGLSEKRMHTMLALTRAKSLAKDEPELSRVLDEISDIWENTNGI